MQRGLVSYNNDHQPSASNQQPNATRYHSVVDGMIILTNVATGISDAFPFMFSIYSGIGARDAECGQSLSQRL